jgi:type I restriction enzyme R subunit
VKDYFTPNFEKELSIPERTRAFAYHLLRHLWETDITGKTLVFCLDQRHALDMAKYCQEAFNKYNEKYQLGFNHEFAVRITGNDQEASGKYPHLEDFKNLENPYPVIVTTSKLLTTGVDVQTVRNVVIFRNIGSMVEFKQIIGRGTRVYQHPDKRKEKLGFFILEYANHSTALFNDPEWDDSPVAVIEEGKIEIDSSAKGYETGDEEIEVDADAPVPVAEDEEEVPATGIFEERDPDRVEQLRYRMSEDFMRGRINMAAESISFTGPDGRPMDAERFTLFQSELFLKKFENLEELNKVWRDIKARRQFLESEAIELGLQIQSLESIFASKYQVNEVDLYDVLASMVYGARFLTKIDRTEKAMQVNPAKFKGSSEQQAALIKDMLQVYLDSSFEPFSVSQEFWQTSTMKKHGAFADIQRLAGGPDGLKGIVNGLQEALYDARVIA